MAVDLGHETGIDRSLTTNARSFRSGPGLAVLFGLIGFSAILIAEFYSSGVTAVEGTGLAASYLSGMTMLVLPCTLPMVFVIVPLVSAKSLRRALVMAVLFGIGISITLAAYGAIVAVAGRYSGITQSTRIMWFVGGTAAYLFGLSQLGIIKTKIPMLKGSLPNFVTRGGPELQAFSLGLLLGNAGLGCPCPTWYLLLGGVATSGDPIYGAYVGFVQGLGRATPMIAVAVAAALGIDSTRMLIRHKDKVERVTGATLVILGAVIVAFMALGHSWWEATPIHLGWNELLAKLGGKQIAEIDFGGGPFPPGMWWVPWTFIALAVAPFVFLRVKRRRLAKTNPKILEVTQ